ncbi:MAG: efflux RND transporter permease subunit, partial [Pseudomonadota bacterium]
MRPTPPSNADLAAVSVKRPLFAAVLNLLIIIGGLAAMMGIEVRELPDVDRPIVSVNATFPGAAPETIDAEVTRILEDAAARVAGVREVNSSSEENGGRLRIEFNPGIDLDVAANDVRESIASVQRELPERVEQLSIRKADSEGDPVLVIAAQSKTYALEDFTRIVENDIVPELLAVDGVAAIEQFGTRKREMRVVIDPLRLTRFGLTVTDVAAALQGAPFDVPVGSFRSADQQLLIRAEATAATPSMIEAVIITGETRVGDVAQAYFGPADAENYVKLNGEHVIGLGVIRQAQSNTIEISEAVGEKLVQLNARLPEIDLVVTSDNADFIRLSVREVLISLSLTILIVVSTIYLFFGAVRATLIPTLTIPVALIGVIAGIWLLGFSVNLLTLLALVLATGLIVDDAIVVLENIQRLQGQGFRRKASAVLGTRQVFFAVIATTAVLASVFVPISFLPSTAGRLFREFGFVLALAVIISSFVALTLVPAAAAQLRLTAEYQRFTSFASLGKRFGAYYATMLDFVLRAPFLVIAVATAVALGAGFTYTNLKSELVPNEDRGEIVIFANGPDGVGVDFMERQADQIEAILEPLIESGEVTGHFNVIGRWDPNRIWLTATLAPWGERDRSHQDIINSIRAQLSAIPGARIFAFSRNSLNIRGTDNGGVSFAITGNEYASMYDVALEITQQMEALGGLFDNIEIDYQPTQPQVSIQIDRRRASDLGVPLDDLALTLRAMVGGVDLIDLNVDDQAIPIILEAETQAINSPSDLQNLYVRAAGDRLIPLSAITKLVEEGVSAELDRVEQRRAIEIQATLDPSISLAEAVDLLKGLTDDILPTQMGLVLMGQAATLEETTNELAITYA